MTNERAVEILNLDLDILGQYGCETAEAYKMAIQALEAQPCEDCISREEMLKYQQYLHGKMSNEENHKLWNFIKGLPSVTPRRDLAETSQDCIRRQAVIILIDEASEMHPYKVVGDSDTYSNYNQGWSDACDWLYANIEGVPSVTPKYTDEEIDKAQAVEQAYVDKMVELAVAETKRPKGKWIEVEVRNVYATLKCSVCGRVIEPIFDFCKYSYEDIKRSYPYCHCGAYMGGADETN